MSLWWLFSARHVVITGFVSFICFVGLRDHAGRLMGATKSFISKFSNPWEQLTFHYTGTQGKVFNANEDRSVRSCVGVLVGL